jgi:hypothetical protein
MYRVVGAFIACIVLTGCNKERTSANCQLEVARKWNPEIMKTCIEPWSPLASVNATPKCIEVDQAKAFMNLCMKTAGYSLPAGCSALRFEQFDRKCYVTSDTAVQWLDALVESDLLSDSRENPWGGYAWNKVAGRLEWVNFYPTRSECMGRLRHTIGDDAFNSKFYSKPIGCAYNGNGYWRVWVMNSLWGGSELGCIAISEEPHEATDIGMLYGPVLGRESPPPQGAKWHCV